MPAKNRIKPILALWLPIVFCPFALTAQNAQIGGTVQSFSGVSIARASVEFRNQDTGTLWQALTGCDGVYRISGVDPGKYDATVQAAGFKTLVRENIVIAGGRSRIHFEMAAKKKSHISPSTCNP